MRVACEMSVPCVKGVTYEKGEPCANGVARASRTMYVVHCTCDVRCNQRIVQETHSNFQLITISRFDCCSGTVVFKKNRLPSFLQRCMQAVR